LLTLFFDVDTFDVLWFCPVCDDNGRISGWEGTFWDNSDIPEATAGWSEVCHEKFDATPRYVHRHGDALCTGRGSAGGDSRCLR
jgi:hypothetical protein